MKKQIPRIVSICSMVTSVIFCAAFVYQTSQLQALRKDRLNDAVESVHRELLQAPPEYFVHNTELEQTLDEALDQVYQTIEFEDELWRYNHGATNIHARGQHIPTNLRWSLSRFWMHEIDRKLAIDGVVEQLSKYPYKQEDITSRLRTISLQSNPETALWAAKHLNQMNVLSADTLEALKLIPITSSTETTCLNLLPRSAQRSELFLLNE